MICAGMNNSVASGGGMIMTNSNMALGGAMGGGGLVVSSSINKQPPPTGVNMLAPAQQHHPANHAVPQVRDVFFFSSSALFLNIYVNLNTQN